MYVILLITSIVIKKTKTKQIYDFSAPTLNGNEIWTIYPSEIVEIMHM